MALRLQDGVRGDRAPPGRGGDGVLDLRQLPGRGQLQRSGGQAPGAGHPLRWRQALEQEHGGPYPGGSPLHRRGWIPVHHLRGAVPDGAGTTAGADNALPKEPSPEGTAEAVRRQPAGLGGTAGVGSPEPPDPVPGTHHLPRVGGGAPTRGKEAAPRTGRAPAPPAGG